MNNKHAAALILILGILVSGSAALYSVIGLSKLFAGAAVHVMIMASCLEIAKLVVAGSIHTYWKSIGVWLKTYLVSATIILMIITSVGIYGFLSAAFQETYEKDKIATKKIELVETKIENFKETNTQLLSEKTLLIESISDLSKGYNNQNSYIDKNTGEKISYTSSKTQDRLDIRLNYNESRLSEVDTKIESTRDSINKLELDIIDIKLNSEASAELGSLKYVQELSGKPMQEIINWFILVIIVVFDPLAVAMTILGLSIYQLNKPTNETPVDPIKPIINDVISEPEPSITLPTDAMVETPIAEETKETELDRLIDDTFNSEDPTTEFKPLTEEQKRNMSHQQIKTYDFNHKFKK